LAKPDVAIALGERSLRLSPRDPYIFAVYQLMGWGHLVSHRVDEAIDLFIKERTANPKVWTFYYGLAGALALKRDLKGEGGADPVSETQTRGQFVSAMVRISALDEQGTIRNIGRWKTRH
jgi:hypothetical protein